MIQCLQNCSLLAIALTTTMTLTPSAAEVSHKSPQLEQQEVALHPKQVRVTGKQGQYRGQVVVNAPIATTWKVVTDYNNFERFLPNVVSSQLLKTSGNQKVFEQTQRIRAFIFNKQVRVRIAVTETYPQQVAFKVVSGDIKSLQGIWRLQPISRNQVLLVHQVAIDPGSTSNRDLFFRIYKNSLADTLGAMKRESERRATKK